MKVLTMKSTATGVWRRGGELVEHTNAIPQLDELEASYQI